MVKKEEVKAKMGTQTVQVIENDKATVVFLQYKFNDPTLGVIEGESKGVAKCHNDDELSDEIGFALAHARAKKKAYDYVAKELFAQQDRLKEAQNANEGALEKILSIAEEVDNFINDLTNTK